MVLSANTYYQGDSAITAMYQGDVLVYELNPPVIIGKILYTSTDGKIVQPRNTGSTYYGANIISNTYRGGQGVIGFDGKFLASQFNGNEQWGARLIDKCCHADLFLFELYCTCIQFGDL